MIRKINITITIHSAKITLRTSPILIPSNSIGVKRRARSESMMGCSIIGWLSNTVAPAAPVIIHFDIAVDVFGSNPMIKVSMGTKIPLPQHLLHSQKQQQRIQSQNQQSLSTQIPIQAKNVGNAF
uniref:Putative ovule protein n=1 Tax=Solanum chacoense TaxID=4108 RepID=A0A0V0H9I2_SOLCH